MDQPNLTFMKTVTNISQHKILLSRITRPKTSYTYALSYDMHHNIYPWKTNKGRIKIHLQDVLGFNYETKNRLLVVGIPTLYSTLLMVYTKY